ncbi:MAG: electron transfer flavoprotein subunit alpha/FixB family protein, partial [Gemmatimonadota bacterium]|nr:electron transfer flavoprotein subunit alpha/FixB family protein [Gemmatimonadota bacterium]
MSNVFAFAETRFGKLRRAGLEVVTAARQVADQTGGQVHAMLAGAAGIGAHAATLGQHGADVVLLLEHDGFTNYNPEA